MDIIKILQSGSVMRYHNTMIDRKQTLDQHSWEVAIILDYIYPEASKELLIYALVHDAPELYSGDVPAPAKRDVPGLKDLMDMVEKNYAKNALKLAENGFSEKDLLAVKYADILSGIWFTFNRMKAGDTKAEPIYETFIVYMLDLPLLNDLPKFVLKLITGRDYDSE